MNDVKTAIDNVKIILDVKNDTKLAEYLNIARNTLSTLKKRNSLGSFFEKLIVFSKNVSLDAIFNAKSKDEIECYQLCKEAISITDNYTELKELLEKYVNKEKSLKLIIPLLQSIKGRDFLSRFLESWSGKGERMLLILYYFLEHLKTKNINELKNIKVKFIHALEDFQLSDIDNFHKFVLSDKDKSHLIEWATENLDDMSCFEIINSTDNLLEIIRNELNLLNRITA